MSEKVLISGGSGMLGQALSALLIAKGYSVVHLSRNSNGKSYESIEWNVEQGKLDFKSIENVDHFIHLAGAGIADKAWSEDRKKEIIDSRVKSAELLAMAIASNSSKPKRFISASAAGFYGQQTDEHYYSEEDPAGNDFLGETCANWEKSISSINELGVSTAIVRIGIVLSTEGGALKEMAKPIKSYVGAPLGTGKQYIPWIHIKDLCKIFIHILENNMEGTYNAASPNQVNNKEFTKCLAAVLNKPLFLPNVPAFIMKLILGSRANLVLEGSRVSVEKIVNSGFEFEFKELKPALVDLYS